MFASYDFLPVAWFLLPSDWFLDVFCAFLYGELVIISDPVDFRLRATGTVAAFDREEICSSVSEYAYESSAG